MSGEINNPEQLHAAMTDGLNRATRDMQDSSTAKGRAEEEVTNVSGIIAALKTARFQGAGALVAIVGRVLEPCKVAVGATEEYQTASTGKQAAYADAVVMADKHKGFKARGAVGAWYQGSAAV